MFWCPHCHERIPDGHEIDDHPLEPVVKNQPDGAYSLGFTDGYPSVSLSSQISMSELPFDRARENGLVVAGLDAESTTLLFRRADDVLPEDR